MAKVYTRTGDDGSTGLIGGARASKADVRIAAIGEVDELNASLGVARAAGLDGEIDRLVAGAQARLFSVGAELASEAGSMYAVFDVEEAHVSDLEEAIDAMETRVEPLKHFILPGGSAGAAALHLARAVARRAERAVVLLAHENDVRPEVRRYLNRLSDALFVAARAQNAADSTSETIWTR